MLQLPQLKTQRKMENYPRTNDFFFLLVASSIRACHNVATSLNAILPRLQG